MTEAEQAELDRLRALAREERRARARKRKKRDLIGALTPEQVESLRRAAVRSGPRDAALVALGYHFGLRAGEFGLLRADKVELRPQSHAPLGELRVEAEKDSDSVTQPIREESVRDALAAWLKVRPKTSVFLFPGRGTDAGLDRRTVYEIIYRLGVTAGLPERAIYPHILKSSRATHLLDAGLSLVDVQAWIRHKSSSSTQRYNKLTEAHGRRLDAAFALVEQRCRGQDVRLLDPATFK